MLQYSQTTTGITQKTVYEIALKTQHASNSVSWLSVHGPTVCGTVILNIGGS